MREADAVRPAVVLELERTERGSVGLHQEGQSPTDTLTNPEESTTPPSRKKACLHDLVQLLSV